MNDLSIFRNGEALDYTKMGEIEILPDALGFENFIQAFRNSPNARLTKSQNNVYYNTPAGEIKIYLPRAHGHFFKNGIYGNGKQDRGELTGALMQILDNPLSQRIRKTSYIFISLLGYEQQTQQMNFWI